MNIARNFFLTACLALFASCSITLQAQTSYTYPGEEWARYEPVSASGWDETELGEAEQMFQKAREDVSEATAAGHTVVLVYKGKLVDIWGDETKVMSVYSVRKSMTSMLFGRYIAEYNPSGSIHLDKTLADLGIDDIDKLSEMEQSAALGQMLQGRSCVFHPAAYDLSVVTDLRPDRNTKEPGTYWFYNNWDFNTSGNIFEKATGDDFFEAFNLHIGNKIGLEDFDVTYGSTFKEEDLSKWPAHLFQFSARDMARLGLLMLRKGTWQNEALIPSSWVDRISMPVSTAEDDPAINQILDMFALEGILTGYGYMWWTGETTGDTPLYCALGSNQNLIAVMPTLDTVAVMRMQSGGYDTMFEILAELLEAHPALEPND